MHNLTQQNRSKKKLKNIKNRYPNSKHEKQNTSKHLVLKQLYFIVFSNKNSTKINQVQTFKIKIIHFILLDFIVLYFILFYFNFVF